MLRRALFKEFVLPAAAALTPLTSWRDMHALCEAEFEPLERQRARRWTLIRALLVHAYREVELYRQAMDRAGVDPVEVSQARRFANVPITSKNALRDGFPNRQLARSFRGRSLRYSNTSGSTGRPLLLIQDTRDIAQKYASILRSRVLAGADPLATQVRFTPNECQPALGNGDSPRVVNPVHRDHGVPGRRSALYAFIEKQLVNPLIHTRQMLSPLWPGHDPGGEVVLDPVLDLLDRLEPEVFSVYPLYGLLLARHLRATGRKAPNIRSLIDFSGGLSTPRVSAFISETFGVRTAQACGGCEFARYGASCSDDPTRMHLAETYAYVELIRPDGSLCLPGELGNLIVTSLHSWAMPIIRLEPGDVGRVVEEPCSCGRRSRRLQHGGRVQSLLRNADDQWITGADVWDALLTLDGLRLFQLQQRSETDYRLDIWRAPEALDRAGLDEALGRLLGASARVEIREVPGIPTEASGKLQLVKSSTYEEFRPSSTREQRVPIN